MDTKKKFLSSKQAIVGIILIGILAIIAIFAYEIAPHDPYEQNLFLRYQSPDGPGGEYVLGTDNLGRCVLSRIIVGTRVSLLVGFVAVGISLILGIILGAIAGYVGGWLDEVIMRLMDVILAFPSILLAIFIVAVMGSGVVNAMIAIAIVRIPSMARVTRSQVLSLKEEEFVEAAMALGASHFKILFKHILMNGFAPMMVIATLGMGTAIVTEAGLSFLGLGAQPPTISWGRMLSGARDALRSAPHVTTYSGLAIVFSVLGFNLLGDGLRDIFDPKLGKNR